MNPFDDLPQSPAELRPTLDILKHSKNRIYYHDFGAGFYIKVVFDYVINTYAPSPTVRVLRVKKNNKPTQKGKFDCRIDSLYMEPTYWMHGHVKSKKITLKKFLEKVADILFGPTYNEPTDW